MKVAIMIDSSFGITEVEARKMGLYFVPIMINIDGVEKKSGVDMDLNWLYKNLKMDSSFKTSACVPKMMMDEWRKALKENDHVLHIPISKHISSTMSTAKLLSEEKEFKGKVTVYPSEFIGPWFSTMIPMILNMMKAEASLEEYIDLLHKPDNEMVGWVFAKNLDRLYGSGRITKMQYMAGSVLKITPIIEVADGRLDERKVIKTRSPEKAIKTIVKNLIKAAKKIEERGKKPKIVAVILDNKETNENLPKLLKALKDENLENVEILELSAAIVGHVGVGGVGGGVTVDVGSEYIKK